MIYSLMIFELNRSSKSAWRKFIVIIWKLVAYKSSLSVVYYREKAKGKQVSSYKENIKNIMKRNLK